MNKSNHVQLMLTLTYESKHVDFTIALFCRNFYSYLLPHWERYSLNFVFLANNEENKQSIRNYTNLQDIGKEKLLQRFIECRNY